MERKVDNKRHIVVSLNRFLCEGKYNIDFALEAVGRDHKNHTIFRRIVRRGL